MKKTLSIFVFALFALAAQSQQPNPKFVQAMEKALAGMDTLRTPADWQARSNTFERIAQKETKEWLPAYYVAFCQIMIFNTETDATKLEPLCVKTEQFIAAADSLQPNNSEIYVLKSMAASLRIRLNPMVNGQKYGPLASLALEKAKLLDPTNPRVDQQQGLTLLFTPPQWGGDKVKAKALLEQAAEKFAAFQPASTIHPNWGKEANERFLEMAK